jgi:DNA polymerase-1
LRTLLFDADALAYRDAAAFQRTYDWGDGVVSTTSDIGLAKRNIRLQIDATMAALEADDLIICLSDDVHNFRKQMIDPTYKRNREEIERPVDLYTLKAWLGESYPSDLRPRLEADDVMGILSTEPHQGDRIIVSQDKDMMTIPGLLYRPDSEDPEVAEITPAAADRWHLMQTLMGDQVDGYPGARRVGPIAAAYHLDNGLGVEPFEVQRPRLGRIDTKWRHVPMENPWHIVVSLFRKAGGTAKDALTQARLARILRHGEWDGGPILWNPSV